MSSAPQMQELAGYRIVRELGRGGMGLVYEAEHLRLGRSAALKVLDPNLAADESFRERFVQESRLVAAIDHPNIIPIYDAGEADGVLYIAMRLVEGCDLEELVAREGPLAPERALEILDQAAAALDAAHARDLVHRDVKPANVMIDDTTGRTFLMDFGIAKQARTRATKTGLFVGSVDYAPPEQIEGKPTTSAADVYALGCVLYQCLTGRRPFEKETDVAVIYAHLLEPPPRPTESRPELSAGLDAVVATALAKRAEERYASCGELVAAVRAALGGAVVPSPPPAPTLAPHVALPQRPLPESNVPVPATPLVGRERELERICELVTGRDVRLVTVTGPGGSGKTRLAIEAARAVEDEFGDGVFFVPLETIDDAGLVPDAIAEVLGVEEGAAGVVVDRLRQRLKHARLLLLLDNFEHVLPAAPLVAQLIAAGPASKVLVTSQAALRLQGEHEFPVPPLELPPPAFADAEALAAYASVALFAQRAQAVRPDFEVSEENAPAVAELCSRLDGLPLAIELAAARVKLLSPQAMLAKLDDRFALLTGGARDLPSRHQTLRGTIEWSYELLDGDDQVLFARLAAFEGGATLEAAEAVCGTGIDVVSGIESLVDKSLLRLREGADGAPRFDMLQTIKEFARYALIERGEVDAVGLAHAEHFLALAEEAEPGLFGAEQAEWVTRLEEEAGNMRAALSWSVDGGDLETGLRIAGALTRFWSIRGHMSEGRRWLSQALDRDASVSPQVRAKALFAAGYAGLGQSDFDDAFARFEESLDAYRAIGDSRGAATCLAQLGWLLMARGELDRATSVSEESLSVAREHDDDRTASAALSNLADVAARSGDLDRAARLFGEALDLRRELGDRRNVANALLNLARTELLRGNDDRAVQLLEEGLELASNVNDTWGISVALSGLGRIALRRGDASGAGDVLAQALRWCRERGDRRAAAECLTGLAAVAALETDVVRAARLTGAADALRDAMAVPPSPIELSIHDEHLAALAEKLGRDALDEELAAGRRLEFEHAVRYALGRVADAPV